MKLVTALRDLNDLFWRCHADADHMAGGDGTGSVVKLSKSELITMANRLATAIVAAPNRRFAEVDDA